ncbi:ADP-ribosylation factor 2-like [Oppia nitens]|uniref:ADP-ribosylation factor 2-like n=1 Tax=Oppia nitens TaxID=1686743 RepID=UPI0023DC99F9|nr:ADP-ribosylation factor 2-like [Oppia nitens]
MGNCFGRKCCSVTVIGPSGSGKTSLVQRLQSVGTDYRSLPPVPTIGFNIESIELKRYIITVWDYGGGYMYKMRSIWDEHFVNIRALVLVVDSSDGALARIAQARQMLWDVLDNITTINNYNTNTRVIKVLVVANKCDLNRCLTMAQLYNELAIDDLLAKRVIQLKFVQASVVNDHGLNDILQWLKKLV